MTKFTDIADLTEDERIRVIADHVMSGEVVGFAVDYDDKTNDGSKGDRYIRKLKAKLPHLVVLYRAKGPVPNCEFIKVKMES